MSVDKVYLTAVTIVGGIITLIDESGRIKYYRQRGINQYNEKQKQMLIKFGLLNRDYLSYKELPKNVAIAYEDEDIQGKAFVTFPSPNKIKKMLEDVT